MSNPNVAEELKHIREKVDQHDQLMVRMVELQERQIAQNDRMSEYMERTDKRLDKIEDNQVKESAERRESISKVHTRVDDNKATILRWSGGIAAIIGSIGLIAVIIKIVPSG